MSFYQLFRDLPTAYRMVPFWFWNGDMDPEQIVQQIQEMAKKGVGGFFICARQGLTIPYLSEQWFQRVAIAIQTAQQCGLEVWLYDEYPYPSGMSGGEVTLQHPDAKQRQLLHYALTVSGPHTLSYQLPWARVLSAQAIPLDETTGTPRWSHALDLTSSIGSAPAQSVFQSTGLTKYTNKRFFTASPQKQLVWNVPPGRWMVVAFLEQEIDDFKYFGTYVDPCHKEAIQTFLATTHDQYAQRFGAQFGETIKGFFTDEVGLLGRIPWSARLPTFFHTHYGYDLVNNLAALLHPRDEKTAQLRYHFFQSIHDLLSEAYHQPLSDWCDQHHLHYVTEVPSVRMTTQLYSHIPGGDSAHEKIGRSLEWILDRYTCNLRADPKTASSLARQLGRERASIECFHSVGWSMTLQDAKWMFDRLAALGINLFVLHAFFYSISGLRKHDAAPSQFLQNPYWAHFRQLADYAGRLCYVMSQGRANISIAVLHPTTTFWTQMGNPFQDFRYCGNDPAEERHLERLKQDWTDLCKHLLLHQIDYDHLDPQLLAEASIEDKHLSIGHARYAVIILPPMTNLEGKAWSQLKAFLQAGGKVISVGLLPYEQIDYAQSIEAEMLAWFGLTTSPQQSYWQELSEKVEDEQTQELHWTKGDHEAYFIPGNSQYTHTIQLLLTLLQQCNPQTITLESPTGDCQSFLMQQRDLPDSSQLVFITHQEGTRQTVHLHVAHHTTRQSVEHLDLTSGKVTSVPIEQIASGWSIPLSFAPYESHLLRLFSSEEPLEADAREPQPWLLSLDLQENWTLTPQQDNTLRIGSFHFTLDLDHTLEHPGIQTNWAAALAEQTWHVVETKPLINQCADLATTQTFPLHFNQSFGTPIHSSLAYPLHCWYQNTFFVEQLPTMCKLVMDKDAITGTYTLYLNEQALTFHDFVSDYQQLACEVQQFLKPGINYLVLHIEAQQDEDGIRDPLYLQGPFGVFIAGASMPTIGILPTTGRLQSVPQQGYLYYAGTRSFTRKVSIQTLPQEKTFALSFLGWDEHIHDCVEVLVNNHSLGVCAWSPYYWEGVCSMLLRGVNTVEIRVTNTLNSMLEGTYFDEFSHQIVPIAL